MDYTKKTKTFIAFINKDKKDKFWMYGNYCFDEETPKVYPYETKEDKKAALEIGKRFGVWSETSDIEAVVLKVMGEPFSIIDKAQAKIYEKQLQKEEDERVAERKAKELSESKPKKLKEEKVEKVLPIILETKEVSKVLPTISEGQPEKKRGRPKIVFDD